ncbi:DUF459 domain-containing protein [Roseomonas genomospecies 6]|uniref:DUF459 domain-containing protein n=1 Tax=Roseomonas genomospecies 6 TaxID=214106 RepID=A0A9W7KPR9_9PROT|nr:DUF459 domain-containing protein [Roseomonas genomospecies 6]KAA0676959.1 DUF459 domain-containing protein [Roseomonas genomospecies 6]
MIYVIEGLNGDEWQELLRTSDTGQLRSGWRYWRDRHAACELRILLCWRAGQDSDYGRYLVEMFEADGRTRTGWTPLRTATGLLAAAVVLAVLNAPSITAWAVGLKAGRAADAAVTASQTFQDAVERLGVSAVTTSARTAAAAVRDLRFPTALAHADTRSGSTPPMAKPAVPPSPPEPLLPEPPASDPLDTVIETSAPIADPFPLPAPDAASPGVLAVTAEAPAESPPPVPPRPPKVKPARLPAPKRADADPAPAVVPPPALQRVPQAAPAPAATAEAQKTVLVFGDSLAQGLGPSLSRLLRADHVRVLNDGRVSTGLSRLDFFDWGAELERLLRSERITAAVVLLGANDPQGFVHDDRRHREAFRTPAWTAAYGRRVRETIGRFRSRGIPLVWVGLPVMRGETFSQNVRFLNDIYRQAAAETGTPFVDLWPVTVGADGDYSAYLGEREGRPWKLRSDDGIHFSPRGYEWIVQALLPVLRLRLAEQ